MSCCGDRRRTLAQSYSRPAPAQKPAVAPPPTSNGPLAAHAPMLVRYLGRGDIVTQGPVTNKAYAFFPARPVQAVEAADAPLLLRDAKFRRA